MSFEISLLISKPMLRVKMILTPSRMVVAQLGQVDLGVIAYEERLA